MASKLKYLLDTHALIWATADEEKLGTEATRILATTAYDHLAISDVTLQEIGLLVHSGKIKFTKTPRQFFDAILPHLTILPITLEIALAAPELKLPHADQFDRIITATAKIHRLTLITKDANITDSGLISTAW